MRNLLKDELSISEIKDFMKGLKKPNNKNNTLTILAIIGGVVVTIAAIYGAIKFFSCKCDECEEDDDWDMDFEEGSCDENGCYYSEEADFEE